MGFEPFNKYSDSLQDSLSLMSLKGREKKKNLKGSENTDFRHNVRL